MSSTNIYCVYLTVYHGNKLPPFYIGSSNKVQVHRGYKGSVASKKYKNIWNSEIKTNPNLFKTFIISTHNTRKEAFAKEELLQKKLNVVKSELYINECFANKGFDNFGKPVDSETKKKMSIARLKRRWWNNGVDSVHLEFPPSDYIYRGRLTFNNKGAQIGANIVKNMIWITDGVDEKMIDKNEIPQIGWKLGRKESLIKGIPKPNFKCRHWKNGDKHMFCSEQPGPDWVIGRPFAKRNKKSKFA
jgi:hypothetical protein